MKFLKNPAIIEPPIIVDAIKLTKDNKKKIDELVPAKYREWVFPENEEPYLKLTTLDDDIITVEMGDWVIKGIWKRDFYSCKQKYFKHLYKDIKMIKKRCDNCGNEKPIMWEIWTKKKWFRKQKLIGRICVDCLSFLITNPNYDILLVRYKKIKQDNEQNNGQ